jgi:hypothetical protein
VADGDLKQALQLHIGAITSVVATSRVSRRPALPQQRLWLQLQACCGGRQG